MREQMSDNQRVLLAKLNVFIRRQGGINRRFARQLTARHRRRVHR
jgi:hypothetical protein